MVHRLFSVGALALLSGISFVPSHDSPSKKVSEYPTPSIREQQEVVVNGAPEIWRLEWKGQTKPYCGATEASMAITCPCNGFAYGESGDLYLVRLRGGKEVDRLPLTPLFQEQGTAVLQRWPKNDAKDFRSNEGDISGLVSGRPVAHIMGLEDYDHDGRRTEFYLQTDALPCGKSVGVVVGLSRDNPRLHAFGTVANPAKPLYLFKWEWQALRKASPSPVQVIDWRCADHGADTQTEVRLQWSAKGIEAQRREYTCPSGHDPRKLIKETPL